MKHKINIKGKIIPNDYKWYYNWLKIESTCSDDVTKVLDNCTPGDEVEVYINSPGGVIDVGSEIYTALRSKTDVKITGYIVGEACSAASIIAMGMHCKMAPTALMMVHCVSTGARGNHSTMEHTAEVLKTADTALCRAYMEKSGMTEKEALEMMEHETWLTAEQAKEKGLIDEIMFCEKEENPLVAGTLFGLPTEEQLEKARRMAEGGQKQESEEGEEKLSLLRAKLKFLKLKGEKR